MSFVRIKSQLVINTQILPPPRPTGYDADNDFKPVDNDSEAEAETDTDTDSETEIVRTDLRHRHHCRPGSTSISW